MKRKKSTLEPPEELSSSLLDGIDEVTLKKLRAIGITEDRFPRIFVHADIREHPDLYAEYFEGFAASMTSIELKAAKYENAIRTLKLIRQKTHSTSGKASASIKVRGNAEVTKGSSKQRLIKPPGHWLNSVAEFIYSKKTYERVFKQTIFDWRKEYYEALAAGDEWKARWINVRGAYSVTKAAVMRLPLIGKIRGLFASG